MRPDDDVDRLSTYIVNAFKGRNGAPRVPRGPIAIVQPDDSGDPTVVRIIQRRSTATSRRVAALFALAEQQIIDALGYISPEIPANTPVFEVTLETSKLEPADLERVNLTSGPTLDSVVEGSILLIALQHDGPIVAMGQVGHVHHQADESSLVTFSRSRALTEPVHLTRSE